MTSRSSTSAAWALQDPQSASEFNGLRVSEGFGRLGLHLALSSPFAIVAQGVEFLGSDIKALDEAHRSSGAFHLNGIDSDHASHPSDCP